MYIDIYICLYVYRHIKIESGCGHIPLVFSAQHQCLSVLLWFFAFVFFFFIIIIW